VIGLKRKVAHSTLNIVANLLAEGRRRDLSAASKDLVNDLVCCFVEVPEAMYPEYVGTARWFYSGDVFPPLADTGHRGTDISHGLNLQAIATNDGNP